MENPASLEDQYRQCLESLAQENAREDALKRKVIRLLLLTILAFIAWSIYFIHSYQIRITLK